MEKPPRALARKRLAQRPQPRHPNSTKNAYILVLGSPNSGKSSTINTLFLNREISKVSPVEGTNSIQEFCTNFRNQMNLKIIDTPGLGTPQNTVWDTKVLASIKKYMDTDDQLRHCIPNAVLIVGRFDDPNLTNPEGPFTKCLKAVNLLNSRLFDKFSCNVIILLTNFVNGDEGYKSNPRLRRDEVMDLIKNYTELPQMPYIIIGENAKKGKSSTSSESKVSKELTIFQHPEYGTGCYKLGEEVDETYPCNLIHLLIKISGGSTKGALGPEFFRNVFRNRESIFLWKSCTLPLVASDRQRFRRAFYLLKEAYQSGEDGRDSPTLAKS